jgi:hypothetical protein
MLSDCIFATLLEKLPEALSGSSSVGRARPCQGRGRGFESRLPLSPLINVYCPGGETGRHAGLKILWPLRPCRFDSGSGYFSIKNARVFFTRMRFFYTHALFITYICI